MAATNFLSRVGWLAAAGAVLLGAAHLVNGWGNRGAVVGPDDVTIGAPGAPGDDQIVAVAFAPDGRTVATATRGGEVALRNDAGEPLLTWRAHEESANAVAFLSDPSALVSAGRSGVVRVWAVSAGTAVLRSEFRETGPVTSLAATPDGRTVAVGAAGRVALWRLGSDGYAPMAELATPPYPINALAFSPGGCTLAAGCGGDGCVRIWRLGGASESKQIDASPEHQVRGLRFDPDGSITAVDTDGNVIVADRDESGRVVERLRGPSVRQAAPSPDGRRVFLAHTDGTARLVSAAAGAGR